MRGTICRKSLYALVLSGSLVIPMIGQQITAPIPQPGTISGTVMDVNDDVIPGANVLLEGSVNGDSRSTVSGDNGSFTFNRLEPGVPSHVTISADGFVAGTSPTIIVTPGQFLFLNASKLTIAAGATSVVVYSSPEHMAVEQVKIEEQQRVFGIIPNFYVTYDHDAAPLMAKLKFKLALKASTDPVIFAGVALVAGADQAGDTPN